MKYRNFFFSTAIAVAVCSSLAFTAKKSMYDGVAYYKNIYNECVEGEVNDPLDQCTVSGIGADCTITDPDLNSDVMAFADNELGFCYTPIRKIN